MFEGVLVFLLQGVEFVVVIVYLELLSLIQFLQLRQFLFIFLLGLSFSDGNQVLLLPLDSL